MALTHDRTGRSAERLIGAGVVNETLQATLWGHSFPKPSGGWIRRRSVTTSRCLILPLNGKK